ncbi:MAG: hypothetical protein V3R81_11175 [Gammaproteobacteria bacterium]
MNDQPDHQLDSDDSFAARRRDYQSIQAPPGLETSIKARARELGPSKGWVGVWRPVTVGLALALGLVAVLPLVIDRTKVAADTPPLPSLTALSRSLPTKPATSMPSFSQLKSLSAPAFPVRPKPAETTPQSRDSRQFTESLFAYVQEKHDENA